MFILYKQCHKFPSLKYAIKYFHIKNSFTDSFVRAGHSIVSVLALFTIMTNVKIFIYLPMYPLFCQQ